MTTLVTAYVCETYASRHLKELHTGGAQGQDTSSFVCWSSFVQQL